MNLHKKICAGLIAAGLFFAMPQMTYAEDVETDYTEENDSLANAQNNVPSSVYTWVLSTARANYYFNHQQINYAVGEDGFIDLNTLIVPTICIYDEIQKQDVISKRRWNMQSLNGYDKLVGRASYLQFKFKEGTVQVTERIDLDDQWGTLDTDKSGKPVKLHELKKNSVECKFYRAILFYAKKHNVQIIKHSWGKLSERDKLLNQSDMPLMQLIVP